MRKVLLIFVSFFLLSSLFSQTFTALNSGTASQLNGIDFFTDTKGIVVGGSGSIRTTSNGLNWTPRSSGVTSDLMDVKYINANMVIAVGLGGTILKSTNAGYNWTTKASPGGHHLTSICVNGSDIYVSAFDGMILKSNDEGETWTVTNLWTGDHVFKIFFTNETVGYAVGNGAYIYKTTNGGITWSSVVNDFTFDTSTNFQFRDIYFTDANNGFIVGGDLMTNAKAVILKTTNGGVTWTSQIVYGSYYIGIQFLNSSTGVILNKNSTSNTSGIRTTNNGGLSWDYLTSLPNEQTRFFFPSPNIGYTCGTSGTIFKGTNINLSIEDLENDIELSVYPNPCNDKITISFSSPIYGEVSTVEVYSISGEKLISQSTIESIDVSELSSGVYLLKARNETYSWTKKIIKE